MCRPHGATVARLTPDQKVGCSNHSGVTLEIIICTGVIAQLVERLLCMQKAGGSNPSDSTFLIFALSFFITYCGLFIIIILLAFYIWIDRQCF